METGFSAGRVLSRSLAILGRNLIPFWLLGLLASLPTILYVLFVKPGEAGGEGFQRNLQYISMFSSLVLGPLVTGTVTYGVVMALRGKPVGIGDCILKGASRLLPVLGVSILLGLIVGVGFLLLIVPGIIFWCMFFVAIPAAVVEAPGVGGALERSQILTKGHRWSIFAITLAYVAMAFVLGLILAAIAPMEYTSWSQMRSWILIEQVLTAPLTAFVAVCAAVAYHDLRVSKEGASIDDLVEVFS